MIVSGCEKNKEPRRRRRREGEEEEVEEQKADDATAGSRKHGQPFEKFSPLPLHFSSQVFPPPFPPAFLLPAVDDN